tara:strand:+ start:312 stop:773 length:462 start_codon:yes stop_codon:yes gene_type:complete
MKLTKKTLQEMIEQEIEEAAGKRKQFSPIKPWESDLVFFDKSANAPSIPPRMVRIKAEVDSSWTHSLKKNYQQNNVVLTIMQDYIDGDGRKGSSRLSLNINGKFIEPDPEGRFWDVDNWILMKKGVTDKWSNLLDLQGNILATKKQQNKWSGV